jgi:SAM-dependent methyltransferase
LGSSATRITNKYAQPEVVSFWKDFSSQGLQAGEWEMMHRYAPVDRCRDVIDLGCGGGRAGLALAPAGYRVTGLDITWEMTKATRQAYLAHNLPPDVLQADIQAIPCTDDSYDAALIFIAALQHIPGRTARRKTLAEIGRILRPDGVLILALDNIAPALTCYAWWVWRKLASVSKKTPKATSSQDTTADNLIYSNRTKFSGLVWHLRGLLRSLHWRTWTGILDLLRQFQLISGEKGDTFIDQVSLNPTPGRVYYHIYEYNELVEDATAANLALIACHSGRELSEKRAYPPRVRQLDKQVFYAFTPKQ